MSISRQVLKLKNPNYSNWKSTDKT